MITDRFGNEPDKPDPCLTTCVGSSGFGKTRWYGEPGRVYTTVDISKCNFVDVPIMTTSLDGERFTDLVIGMTSPTHLDKSDFSITILGRVKTAWRENSSWLPSPSDAESWKWSVNWIAVGYTCS